MGLQEDRGPWPKADMSKAQLVRGILCHFGIGVAQGGLHASKWYRSAAERNDAMACKNLGTLYLVGLAGTVIDKEEAYHCFSRARALELEQSTPKFNEHQTIHSSGL